MIGNKLQPCKFKDEIYLRPMNLNQWHPSLKSVLFSAQDYFDAYKISVKRKLEILRAQST